MVDGGGVRWMMDDVVMEKMAGNSDMRSEFLQFLERGKDTSRVGVNLERVSTKHGN